MEIVRELRAQNFSYCLAEKNGKTVIIGIRGVDGLHIGDAVKYGLIITPLKKGVRKMQARYETVKIDFTK